MRWKDTAPEIIPDEGTVRLSYRFLWFPLNLGGETRWLENVTIRQRVIKTNTLVGSLVVHVLPIYWKEWRDEVFV